MELALDGCTLTLNGLQTARTTNAAPDNVAHQAETSQHEQREHEADLTKSVIKVVVATDDSHRPARLTLNWSIENVVLLTILVDDVGMSAPSCHHLAIDVIGGSVFHAGSHFLNVVAHHQTLNRANHQLARAGNHQVIG